MGIRGSNRTSPPRATKARTRSSPGTPLMAPIASSSRVDCSASPVAPCGIRKWGTCAWRIVRRCGTARWGGGTLVQERPRTRRLGPGQGPRLRRHLSAHPAGLRQLPCETVRRCAGARRGEHAVAADRRTGRIDLRHVRSTHRHCAASRCRKRNRSSRDHRRGHRSRCSVRVQTWHVAPKRHHQRKKRHFARFLHYAGSVQRAADPTKDCTKSLSRSRRRA